MTWCIGIRSRDAVFLVADTARTSNEMLRSPSSTFSELHIDETTVLGGRKTVQESNLKIFRIGEIAITFAGSVDVGLAFVHAFDGFVGDMQIDEAITSAINSTSANASRSATVLIAIAAEHPRLVRVILVETTSIDEIHDSVSIGSISETYCEIVEKLRSGMPRPDGASAKWIVQLLAVAQSFGLHHTMLEQGIGGAFAGAWVDVDGFHWTPDTLYVIHDDSIEQPQMVGVMFREDVFCVPNSTCGENRCFANPTGTESIELTRQRASRALHAALIDFDDARFEFIVFLNWQQHIVTAVEMRKQTEHQLLVLVPASAPSVTIGIFWSEQLQHAVTTIPQNEDGAPPRDICLRWYPYRAFDSENDPRTSSGKPAS